MTDRNLNARTVNYLTDEGMNGHQIAELTGLSEGHIKVLRALHAKDMQLMASLPADDYDQIKRIVDIYGDKVLINIVKIIERWK
jgi:nitrogen regulatory protein PII-like uncharacterized protein